MTTGLFYDKEIQCLLCDEKFTIKKIRQSKLAISKRDTDFCNYFTNEENPYFYEIWVCPHCGFSFNANFKTMKPAQKEVVYKEYTKRIGKIKLEEKRTLEDALQAYKLALLCGSIGEQDKTTIAGIILRIAWLYRFQGNPEEEQKYLAKAAKTFQEIFENEDLSNNPLGENKIIYLLGELNGRLGNLLEARRWFNILLSKRNVEPSLKNLARDQWVYYKTALA